MKLEQEDWLFILRGFLILIGILVCWYVYTGRLELAMGLR